MKPKVKLNVSLTISCKDLLDRTPNEWDAIMNRFEILANSTNDRYSVEPTPPTSLPKGKAPPPPPPPSRHYQAVAANQRISEAVEQINKLKALYPDNVEFHQILNSIKQVLLGT